MSQIDAKALRRYALHMPFDAMKPRDIRLDLLRIAGDPHLVRAWMDGKCRLCGRSVRDEEVHLNTADFDEKGAEIP